MRRIFWMVLSLFVIASLLAAPALSVRAAEPVPTPTALPYNRLAAGADQFTLRPWSVADTQAAIASLQSASDALSLPADPAKSYSDLDYWQATDALLQEATARFAKDPSATADFRAQRVTLQAKTVGVNGFGQPLSTPEPLRDLLENALNSGKADEKDIRPWLTSVDAAFTAEPAWQVKNMYLKGIDGVLWTVHVNKGATGLFAVRKYSATSFKVYSLTDAWQPAALGADIRPIFTDLDGNNRAEITFKAIWFNWYEVNSCTQTIDSYEWNGSAFINLTGNVPPQTVETFNGSQCQGYTFVPAPGGAQSFFAVIRQGQVISRQLYELNAGVYRWSQEVNSAVPAPADPSARLNWALQTSLPTAETGRALEEAVAAPPADLTAQGAAAIDFARFRLAAAYAYTNQSSKAVDAFRALIQKPTAAESKQVVAWAKQFVRYYAPDIDLNGKSNTVTEPHLFLAALQTNRLFEIERARYRSGSASSFPAVYDGVKMKVNWGYVEPAWLSDSGSAFSSMNVVTDTTNPHELFNIADLFRHQLEAATLPSPQSIVPLLEQNQVPTTGLVNGDIDGDYLDLPATAGNDHEDWLFLAGTGYEEQMQLWAVLRDADGRLHARVAQNFPATVTSAAPTLWRTYRPAYGQGLLNAYLVQDRLLLLRVLFQHNQVGFESPVSRDDPHSPWFGVGAMQVVSGSVTDDLHVSELNHDAQILGWNDASQQVTFPGPSLATQVGGIEQLLFDPATYAPDEAALQLTDLLKTYFREESLSNYPQGQRPLPRTRPYLMYLQGVAYEFAGQPDLAVKAYWQLLMDAPESLYGRLARMKVELKK